MIYLFLAEGFEEIEALATVDILRRAGADLSTVGVGGKRVRGSHGIEVTADLEEKQIDLGRMEMVVLPGGGLGTKNLEKSPIVRACAGYCAQNDKYLAAICAAPSILGHMDLLKGRSAVCYPGYEAELKADSIPDVPVCVSGRIVTAKGAGVAVEFALKLVELLYGAEKSHEIRKAIQCI